MDSEPKPNPIEMQFALNQLADTNAERRNWAVDRVKRMGPEEVEQLMLLVKQEGEKQKRRLKVSGWLAMAYLFVLVGVLIVYVAESVWKREFGRVPAIVQMWGFIGIAGWFARSSSTQKNAARALAVFNHPGAVGVYAEALEFNDYGVSIPARDALIRNLPLLNANDGDLLNSDQRRCLHRVIGRQDKDFVLGMAILGALEQVGDQRDLVAVKKLSESEAATPKQKELREEARRILPSLEQRAAASLAASTLLRATQTPADKDVTLLRPAADTEQKNSELLLRPISES